MANKKTPAGSRETTRRERAVPKGRTSPARRNERKTQTRAARRRTRPRAHRRTSVNAQASAPQAQANEEARTDYDVSSGEGSAPGPEIDVENEAEKEDRTIGARMPDKNDAYQSEAFTQMYRGASGIIENRADDPSQTPPTGELKSRRTRKEKSL